MRVLDISTLFFSNHYPICKNYSLRRDVAGLALAALNACVLTISNAKAKAMVPVNGNTHHSIEVLMVYLFKYMLSNHHANGDETTKDTITSNEKSFEISRTRLGTDAPNTFRMPISFVRCSAVKAANPNRPNPVISIASVAKIVANLLVRLMVVNFFWNSTSANR